MRSLQVRFLPGQIGQARRAQWGNGIPPDVDSGDGGPPWAGFTSLAIQVARPVAQTERARLLQRRCRWFDSIRVDFNQASCGDGQRRSVELIGEKAVPALELLSCGGDIVGEVDRSLIDDELFECERHESRK